jgi:hypothetical protein
VAGAGAGHIYHKGQGGPEKTHKNDAPTYLPFLSLFWRFSGLILENVLSSSCRETAKNAIKKNEGGKRKKKCFFSRLFWQEVFNGVFGFSPQKNNGVFELLLLRNAHKNRHKKTQTRTKKQCTYLSTLFSGYLADICRFQHFFFGAPYYISSRGGRGKTEREWVGTYIFLRWKRFCSKKFLWCFLLTLQRNAQKQDKENTQKKTLVFFQLFCKTCLTCFF